MKAYETDSWPLLQARDIGALRSGPPRLVVIHDAEFPEVLDGARGVARYFQHPDSPSSAHISVDNTQIVQSVSDRFIAWAAPGANHDGIQIELVGYQSQSPAQWTDEYSLGVLALGASAVAQYSLKYDIPTVHLSDGELLQGRRGIVGHDQISRVYRRSTHTDPGPFFPWRLFVEMAAALVLIRR